MRSKFIVSQLKKIGKKFGARLIDANVPSELFDELLRYREDGGMKVKSLESDFISMIVNPNDSRAQLYQDLFVLLMTDKKKNGFFVEFGATNGVKLSNSYLLEKEFGWNGILAEPARGWHEELHKNRCASIDSHCVWKESGKELVFNETSVGEFSTIESFSSADMHSEQRRQGNTYRVESVSLNDLLDGHAAPKLIDYLSIDTEGSEFSILSHFDFSKYDIRIITVEHNYTADREKIYTLLQGKGFVRMFEKYSHWDDWYVKPSGAVCLKGEKCRRKRA
jgi:FkbM family methyltransferase